MGCDEMLHTQTYDCDNNTNLKPLIYKPHSHVYVGDLDSIDDVAL